MTTDWWGREAVVSPAVNRSCGAIVGFVGLSFEVPAAASIDCLKMISVGYPPVEIRHYC